MKKLLNALALIIIISLLVVSLHSFADEKPDEPVLSTQQPTVEVLPTQTEVIKPTYTPAEVATHTPQPTATLLHGELNTPNDRYLLVRLCISETQGMTGVRQDACLSVIDTAILRTKQQHLSNGELYDTLSWGWNNSNKVFQFDPWLTLYCGLDNPQWFECNENTEACNNLREYHCHKEYYDTEWAERAVALYFKGKRGSCSGYLYYNSIIGGNQECLIESDNGQFIEFFNKD